ncbi:IucC family-domain-containing protein [Syncephalastrum racemosum]|uniref:IucC family-domain-containing protein n=1 Tax=Syncephalastrum racemosum TaxID=13706 RepID=A0A1X2HUS6_SYNRA|nr:IucC family-domain-containing protein [Syncephalastrum racemosum]
MVFYHRYANFATLSRLIASLTTEKLVSSYYVPAQEHGLSATCITVKQHHGAPADKDLLTAIPLRGPPILTSSDMPPYPLISFLDPSDMFAPYIFGPKKEYQQQHGDCRSIPDEQRWVTNAVARFFGHGIALNEADCVATWRQFAEARGTDPSLSDQIAEELLSSTEHQAYTYAHRGRMPALKSGSINWEQAILEGHATHPMNKARKSFEPMPQLHVQDHDYLMHPRIRLVPFPRDKMQVRGDFEELIRPLIRALGHEETVDTQKFLLVPAHEMQIPNMVQRFHVQPLEGHLTMEALTSIRSVAKPDVLPGLSLKLCLGIKVSSALRTITPYTTYFGPDFSNRIVPQLTYDRNILKIERELASAVVRADDPDVAKHGSCIVRESIEFGNKGADEHYVVCAALVEKIKADSDDRLVTKVWQLDTDEKRVQFLDKYMDMLLQAVLPPCIENGVAFEAHGQNMLARFNADGDLTGFAVRDFGGIKIYPPSLKESCGLELDVLPDSCVVAHHLNEVYQLLYHTLIHSHLQRIIRVLGLHYDGRGWSMLRKYLRKLIPRDHPMWPVFMENDCILEKCLVRMKLEELYRDYIYHDVPNLVLYRPQEQDNKCLHELSHGLDR